MNEAVIGTALSDRPQQIIRQRTWLDAAARYGLQPVSPIRLDCAERVVRWERVDLDFTFLDIVLVKGGWPSRAPWPRARYHRSGS